LTFRAKPITTRKRRFRWDDEERMQLWVTLGFILIIVLALAILAGAVAAGYYDEHFRVVARVEGVEINRDQWSRQQAIEGFRIQQAEGRVRERLAGGTIDETAASQQLSALQTRQADLGTTALEDLIDATLQGIIARKQNLSVTPSDVDAAIREESSIPELRKVEAIFVAPETDAGETTPSETQVEAARNRAAEAVAKLRAGTAFAEVATEYSTDSSRDRGGDYGFIDRTNPTDPTWVEALFALEQGGTTDVIEGEDGVFRIGRVTEVRPPVEDPQYVAQLPQSVSEEDFRRTVEAETLAKKLREKISAPAVAGDVEQLFVREIVVTGEDRTTGQPITTDEVKASHILYSPKDDPAGAANLAQDDPAWTKAEDEAKAVVEELNKIADVEERENRFAEIAAEQSDDQGSGARGGDLGWFNRGTMVQEFGDAVFEGEHTKGDVIGPVRSQFGWHVILYEDRRPPPAQRVEEIVSQVKRPDVDFEALARRYSDASTAASGGEVGWIAPYELEKDVEDVLFRLQPGQVTDALLREGDYYIYKVDDRAKRPIEPARRTPIEQKAFEAWYQPQKDAADIYRDQELLAGADFSEQ
jgi:parvulin-like peptidyl-prolyl isomerase